MSWNAYLTDDRAHEEGSWNYTHNTNGMISLALEARGVPLVRQPGSRSSQYLAKRVAGNMSCGRSDGNGGLVWTPCQYTCCEPSWWEVLDGMDGPRGAALLHAIIIELVAYPAKYRAMNPRNGWGDYDTLVKVLTDMRDAVPEWPTTWETSG